MKKTLSLLLAAVMLLSLCACGPSKTNTPASGLNEAGRWTKITYAINQNVQNLLPTAGTSNPKVYFYNNLYEALFDFNSDGDLAPGLAYKYDVEDDTHWVVHLYKTIKDSAGNAIKASDVVFATNWLIKAGEALNYDIFEKVEAIDNYTLRYTWKSKPTSITQVEFPLARTYIFAESAFDEVTFATKPVATGNFVVKEFTTGSQLVLAYNPNYWADNTNEDVSGRLAFHKATVEEVVFSIVSDSSAAQIALNNGTIDYCDYIKATSLDKFQGNSKFTVETSVSADYTFMGFNMSGQSIFSNNKALREAVCYAIDSSAIATALPGSYTAMKTYGTSYFSDFDASWESETNYCSTADTEKAKSLLAQSGYNGEEINIMCKSSEEDKTGVTMLVTMLTGLGMKVKMSSVDPSTFSTDSSQPGAWDILYFSGMSGKDLVGSWKLALFPVNGDLGTLTFINDKTLLDLYNTACADATHDSAHMKAVIDYVFDNALIYPVAYAMSARVYDAAKIVKPYYREGYVTICASTYAGQKENVDPAPVAVTEKVETSGSDLAGTYSFTDSWSMGEAKYTIQLNADGTYRVDCHNPFGEDIWFTGEYIADGSEAICRPPEKGVEGDMDRMLNSGWAEDLEKPFVVWIINGSTATPEGYTVPALTFTDSWDMGTATYQVVFNADGTYRVDCHNPFGEDIYFTGSYTADGNKMVCSAPDNGIEGAMDRLLNSGWTDMNGAPITWIINGSTVVPEGYEGPAQPAGGQPQGGGQLQQGGNGEEPGILGALTGMGFERFDWNESTPFGSFPWHLLINKENGECIIVVENPHLGTADGLLVYHATFTEEKGLVSVTAPTESDEEVKRLGGMWKEDGSSQWQIKGQGIVEPIGKDGNTIPGADDSASQQPSGNQPQGDQPSKEEPGILGALTGMGFERFDWNEESPVGIVPWHVLINKEKGECIIVVENEHVGTADGLLVYHTTFTEEKGVVSCSAPEEADLIRLGNMWKDDGTSQWQITGPGVIGPIPAK